ncbi:hypothetical protein BC834DRAFT_154623 [Gloeopeniophorella convolvens]|nr:hypothetical protein BC834DRAFT_154623 [Gloeopeniophorella convolvens]
MPAVVDVRDTLGAILIGCLVAVALSGVVNVQTFLYYRLYPNDRLANKLVVALVWALDIGHTVLICTSTWRYLIANFGNVEIKADVPITIALSIAFTAHVTLINHLFFSRRLLRLSKNNWFIAGPLVFLAIGRLASGLVTTVELARLQNFPEFTAKYRSVFTLGLALSSVIDVLITFGMCFYLQTSRQGFGTMDEVIDAIIVYTVNNGAFTCVSTIVAMICWLTMPRNLIFMALHFAISKMYANSLLATLNTRQFLRGRAAPSKEADHPMPVLFPDSFNRQNRSRQHHNETSVEFAGIGESKGLHITVEKTVQYDIDDDVSASGPSSDRTSAPFQLRSIGV